MPRYACPVCGDPNAYPLWIDAVPPSGCSEGDHVRSVTECRFQMRKAKGEALRRKMVPDAFDANGVILPGQIGRVCNVLMDAGFDPMTGELYPPTTTPADRADG